MTSIPATMRAAFIRRHDGPDSIEVGTLPVPVPGPAEVLVENAALAVNHVDTFVRSGAYRTNTPFPFIVGRDLVGTVAAVGVGVTAFRPGDTVWCNSLGHDGRQGSFSEYAAVPAERLYLLPDGVDPLDAAGVLHTAATAYLGLFREARLQFGETIYVAGAGGGVGSAVVQVASAAGAHVIASASARDFDWCVSCGAHEVFDYSDPHLYRNVRQAAPDGVDIWWDNSGRNDFDAAIPLLNRAARVVVMSGLGAHPRLPVGDLYTRDASLRGFVISNASTSDLASAASTINHLLADKKLRARIGATLSLDDAPEAHRRMESVAGGQRILVVP